MRLFVAVDLPAQSRKRLAEIVAELRACRADVRWVRAESMHLTLKFLGNVAPHELGAIDEALSRVAGAAKPTRGELHGIGSFPHLRRPRVLWIGVQPVDESLAELHAAIDAALTDLGVPEENRRFRPHITLGRVRGRHDLARLRQAVGERNDANAGWLTIDELTLFESEPRPGGPRYVKLATHRLGASSRSRPA